MRRIAALTIFLVLNIMMVVSQPLAPQSVPSFSVPVLVSDHSHEPQFFYTLSCSESATRVVGVLNGEICVLNPSSLGPCDWRKTTDPVSQSFFNINDTHLRSRGDNLINHPPATRFSSVGVFDMTLDTQGHVTVVENALQQISYEGLPTPASGFRIGSGDVVRLNQTTLLSFVNLKFSPKLDRSSVVCFASNDDGLHWHFVSVVASAEDFPTKEGPNESAAVVLPNGGHILVAFRVADGLQTSHPYKLVKSTDHGHSWHLLEPFFLSASLPFFPSPLERPLKQSSSSPLSPVERPPKQSQPGSVRPRMLILADGTILVTGGRPGMWVWVGSVNSTSADHEYLVTSQQIEWESVNVPEQHNKLVSNASLRYCDQAVHPNANGTYVYQYQAYNSLLLTKSSSFRSGSGTELLLLYDRRAYPGKSNSTVPLDCRLGKQDRKVFAVKLTLI